MRYLIDGCYGDGNVGDECLLDAVIGLIRRADSDARLRVLSSDPSSTARRTGLDAIAQCNPFGANLYGSVIKGQLYRVLQEIRQCDVFVLGGGELLRDQPGWRATCGMLHRMWLAGRLKKRVVAVGVGAQAPRTTWGRWVLANAIRTANALLFRDERAMQIAKDIAGSHPKAFTAPDLVFATQWNEGSELHLQRFSRAPRGIIGVALKQLPLTHPGRPRLEQLPRLLRETFLQLSKHRNFSVQPLPFAEGDVALAHNVKRLLEDAGISTLPIPHPESDELRQAFKDLDCAVSMPFHSTVFGFGMGVPSIGLAYDEKVTRIYESFGMREYCLKLEEMQPERTSRMLDELLNNAFQMERRLFALSSKAKNDVTEAAMELLGPRLV